ncbi:invasion associated locus B family protein [uncultured Methylobacterium sp.]|uniref:invasion associated locus B family protein n=1 Tax=uncultured Methylobacterium sp. TaxID=157278 RepID=UPI0035CC2054
MSTFSPRRIAGLGHGRRAFLVLLANGLLGASLASAQPGPAKPPAASVTAPPVPVEPGTTTASFGDWVLRCQRLGEADKGRLCEVTQAMQVQGQAAPIAQVAIGRLAAGEPLRVIAVLPAAVSFPSSVQILAGDDDGQPLDLPWRRCLPSGCFADAPTPDDVLKRWRNAREPGRITSKDATGREISLPLSLRGLGPALDALARERS